MLSVGLVGGILTYPFHRFHPLISPCGSRCGSKLLHLIKECRQNTKYVLFQTRTAVTKEKALFPWHICLAKMPVLRYAFLEEIFMELRTSRHPINNIVVLQGGFLS